MSAQSVVDLPEPVGPVTSTRPLGRWHSCRISFESPISSAVMMRLGMTRKTPPMPLRSMKKLQRKRARPGTS